MRVWRYGLVVMLAASVLGIAGLMLLNGSTPSIETIGFGEREFLSHQIMTDSRALWFGAGGVTLQVEVDRNGAVVGVSRWPYQFPSRVDPFPIIKAVWDWRFRPFTWKGRRVNAVALVDVSAASQAKWDDPNAPFPAVDGDDWSITLARSACYGACPDYRLTIKGNGTTVFTTDDDAVNEVAALHRHFNENGVLLPGRHIGHIDQRDATRLLDQFRQAHFFGLMDRYHYWISDGPTYQLTVTVGQATKTVSDYMGPLGGMPIVVRQLEDDVDRLGGSERWIKGDVIPAGTTPPAADPEATLGLIAEARQAHLPAQATLKILEAAAASGDAADKADPGPVEPDHLLILEAIRLGRPRALASLIGLGWDQAVSRADIGRSFASGAGCNESTAEQAIALGIDPGARDKDGKTALINVQQACGPWDPAATARFATVLLKLGVPLNAADSAGQTALFHCDNVMLAELLLRMGARTDIHANNGASPATSTWDDRTAVTLLDAGADPNGPGFESPSLRAQAKKRAMPATLAWLDAHHIP